MTKKETIKKLVQWLKDADRLSWRGADNVHRFMNEQHREEAIDWFAKCEVMHAAFFALLDDSTGEEMPIDSPAPGYDGCMSFREVFGSKLPNDRPAMDFSDYVGNDGINSFVRGNEGNDITTDYVAEEATGVTVACSPNETE